MQKDIKKYLTDSETKENDFIFSDYLKHRNFQASMKNMWSLNYPDEWVYDGDKDEADYSPRKSDEDEDDDRSGSGKHSSEEEEASTSGEESDPQDDGGKGEGISDVCEPGHQR
jgi:hypothetical protein